MNNEQQKQANQTKKKSIWKNWWFWLIIFFVLFIVGSLSEDLEIENEKEITKEKIELTLEERIEQEAKNIVKSHESVRVSYEEKNGVASLVVEDEEVYTASSAVRDIVSYFMSWGIKIEDEEGIKTIEVTQKTVIVDYMGEENKEDFVKISMDIDNFKQFNWKNLEYIPVYEQIQDKGKLEIHPAAIGDINLKEDTAARIRN